MSITLLDDIFGPNIIIHERLKICKRCHLEKPLLDFKTSFAPEEDEPIPNICYSCLQEIRQIADEKRAKTKERKEQVKNHKHASIAVGMRLQRGNEAWARYICNSAKARAKVDCVPYTITYKDVLDIIPEDGKCPILGIELIPNKGKKQDNSPTLDKIKPELGYTVGNIIIVCERVNRAKNNLSIDEIHRIWLNYTEFTLKKKIKFIVEYS